jgi:hypothetical protein
MAAHQLLHKPREGTAQQQLQMPWLLRRQLLPLQLLRMLQPRQQLRM